VGICRSREEAERALASARAVWEGRRGLRLQPDTTRIVHITQGFEFLGYKIGRGKGLRYTPGGQALYAIPRDRSIRRFTDKVRAITQRRNLQSLAGMVDGLNPVVRGWGMYYRRAHVRRLFHWLDRWIVRRVWSFYFQAMAQRRVALAAGAEPLRGTEAHSPPATDPSMASYYRQKGYPR
jgi:RNA-directed DNA polymerase